LLNLPPSGTPEAAAPRRGRGQAGIARRKFPTAAKSFRALAAAVIEFAAVQCGWRDFRIAQRSFERADPRCQKIGRRRLLRTRKKNNGGFR